MWQQRARHALLQHGQAPTDEAVQAAATALLEAQIDGAELVLDGKSLPATLEAMPVAARPAQPTYSSRAARAVPLGTSAVTFSGLLEEWERERRPAGRTKLDFARAMRRLAEHVGHEDAARLTRDDIAGLRDAALERAPGRPHSTRSALSGQS
jgi:hypothetical protein